LTSQDYINIVAFNDIAITNPELQEEILYPANSSIIGSLNNWLESIIPENDSNFNVAFQKAFEIFNSSNNLLSYGCQNIILFFTDGYSNQSPDDPINVINTLKTTSNTPRIFSYSIGDGADDEFNKNIACQYNGVFTKFSQNEPDTQLATQINIFKNYLRNYKAPSLVYWTEPYIDFILGVDVVTAALACYSDNGRFLGVVGTDLLASNLIINNNITQTIEKFRLINSQFCQSNLSASEIESLREGYQKCNAPFVTINFIMIVFLICLLFVQ